MTPGLAAEVTLQPVRRFGFDAAIIFSDILVVPAAVGVRVEFEDGPKLSPVSSAAGLKETSARRGEYFEPVYEALKLAKAALGASTALLGFAGGAWTLASYLAAGGGGDDQKAAKLWAYRDPGSFQELADILTGCVSQHLIGQLNAGADAVQIFDSWASGLPPPLFSHWVIAPTKKIVATVRAAVPRARIIGFPRAATLEGYLAYAGETGVDAVSVDTAMPMGWAVAELGPHCVLQGNLDPVALVAGGRAMAEAVDGILEATSGTPFIFNLGHGILPETPLAHVYELVNRVRALR